MDDMMMVRKEGREQKDNEDHQRLHFICANAARLLSFLLGNYLGIVPTTYGPCFGDYCMV